MRFLVCDSSIVVDKLRGGKSWTKFVGALDEEDAKFYLSTISIFELYSGESTRNPAAAKVLREALKLFEKVEVTTKIAQRAGEIYRDAKVDLEMPDYVIAATALELGAEVVTLNRKHFGKVPGVRVFAL